MSKAIPFLFSRQGLEALHRFIDRTTLFAFDLDGTLTAITEEPQDILIPAAVREELRLLVSCAPVAIITGRSRSDAWKHLGVITQFLIGNHGAEGLPGWESRENEFIDICFDWERQLDRMNLLTDVDGISIENKGMSLSIHYRPARNRKKARSSILRNVALLSPKPRLVEGKCVENLMPEGAPDKGKALLCLMEAAKSAKGFYAGDDATDEDVFRIGGNNLFTVRVGNVRVSHAQYRLKDQTECFGLLKEINRVLAGPIR